MEETRGCCTAKSIQQALIEYTFLLILVAMVVLAVLLIFGPQLGNAFSMITHGL